MNQSYAREIRVFGDLKMSDTVDKARAWDTLTADAAERNADIAQMRAALEEIRDRAPTMPNGGAWAAGMATLCLGTLPKRA
jgi:hypothetical protein